MRIKIINYALIFIFIFLIFGIFNLEFMQGKKFKDLSNKNCIRLIPQQGSRGKILDRLGNILVDNYLSYDVIILPKDKEDIDKALIELSGILGVSLNDLKDTFKKGFVAPLSPITVAENIDIKKVFTLEELKSDMGGVIIQPHPLRYYPYGRLACHVMGYLNEIDRWRLTKLADYGYKTKDVVGFGGVEEKYDYFLRQDEGGLSVEVDHKGRFMRVIGFKSPKNGKDLLLSLDLRIQKIVEDSLQDKKGSVILMDPYSGEILAMASSPDFDLSAFVKKTSQPSISRIFNNPEAPLINRAISSSYPAGSIFKLIVATAALETGKINLNTEFICKGSISIGKQEFSCWNTHNQQNLMQAIPHSCNVFFYRTGLLLGAQVIHDYAVKYAFARATAIDLPYETNGFIPSPLWRRVSKFKSWFDGDTANLAIGQGEVLVTPLQVARMMAVYANKGNLVTPYIVKTIDGKDVSRYQKKIIRLNIKESNLNYINQALRNTVLYPSGTASVLSDLAVSVAGKTGSAQVSGRQPHGWFVGFFPFEKPKFVICVFLENGGAGFYSCVIAKQIIKMMYDQGLID
ncbi:MAG: penicillin-binding protein 2 [Candidatus Omnitrophica bacterium]|nr:penicillin-binding protein 2 [Candidatus Omnitrophota bacterium]